ncbi:MAG: GAF domain-containing protein [Chthonomonadales bacterium]|nr:GAF domain-containing protein [Chthonomonadales bacterium]
MGDTLPSAPAAQRKAFRRIARAIMARQPASETLALIAGEARSLTGATTVAVALRARSDALLEFAAVSGGNPAEIVGLQIPIEGSLAETALRTGQPSLHAAPGPAAGPLPVRTAAVAPVVRDGSVLGAVLALNRPDDRPFAEAEADALSALADAVALALTADETSRSWVEQRRELAVLYDAARTVSGSLNVQEVLTSVLDAICQHVPHQAAALFLLNDERTHLFIAADRGLTDEEREVQLAADGRMTAEVIGLGRSVLIADTEAEPDFESPTPESCTRAAMVAPIRSRNDTLGIVIVTSGQPAAFSENDLKLLSAVGSQAGIAIENAWLYEDATRRAEESTALYNLSQHVSSTLDLDRVYQFVADSVLSLLNVDKFALMLMDRREERLVTRVSRGVDEEVFARVRPGPGEGIAGWVYEWMTPTAVTDVAADARNQTAAIHQAGVVSTIGVPMAVGDDVIGVLLAMSSRRRLFTVAEMELLYTIANQAAVAIVNATLYHEARAKSSAMRGYFNRVARALGAAIADQDVPRLLADLAIEMLRADRCAIYLVDGETARLRASSHFRASAAPDVEVPLGEGLAGWVARRGKALVVDSLADDPRARAHAWLGRDRLESYLGVPLKEGRRTVGVLEVFTVEPRAFTTDEVKLLSQFAQRARLAPRLVTESPAPDA